VKALVFHGPGQKSWEEKSQPILQDGTDAIIRITKTTICGTDLHILKGDVPTVTDGRTLGHEGVGVVEEVGSAVTNFKAGDRVLISCITACGRCEYCKISMYSHCVDGGWILGHLIDGTQAEYVRIPHADTSLYHVPDGVDEEALVMLSDILPTGYEVGVINGQVKPADTVAIVGAGPVGLAALLTARFYAPAEIIMIDVDTNRLDVAQQFGATQAVNSQDGQAVERVMELTNHRGVDVAIEAVGIPVTFDICQKIVTAGGHIANAGVHGKSVDLHLETLWSHNITLTTGLVDTYTTPKLLKMVRSGKLEPAQLITHRFQLGAIMDAYTTFSNAAQERALKVILTNE
jgi:alcohol dehydrogenase